MERKVLVVQKHAVIDFEGLKGKLNDLLNKANKYDLSLPITNDEDNIAIKKILSDLRKDLKLINDERIALKKAILEPYDKIEELIKEYDKLITAKINKGADNVAQHVEVKKSQITSELEEYFKKENPHSFISFERLNINVTASGNVTNLKKEIDQFISIIETDIQVIMTQEENIRIMSEYEKTLDVSQAIMKVNNQVAREKELQAKVSETVDKPINSVKPVEVEELVKQLPIEEIKKERTLKYRGEIQCTESQFIMLKSFCINNGIKINVKEQLS